MNTPSAWKECLSASVLTQAVWQQIVSNEKNKKKKKKKRPQLPLWFSPAMDRVGVR